MNAITKYEGGVPSLQMGEAELISVLRNSLYPGAKDESIKLVIGYCRAGGLDPLQKPVHIVPMSVKIGKKADGKGDVYETRDIIMPGVGLYRTQAVRSGQLAGISEPEFGPIQTMQYKAEKWEEGNDGRRSKHAYDAAIEYPEWCKVTVRRLLAAGGYAEYTAIEYWRENYATAGRDTDAPNAMWTKRPRGQIAKCAQAQALRMAFPEMTGSQPTADEMEGKTLDDSITGEVVSKRIEAPAAPEPLPANPEAKIAENLPAWRKLMADGKKTAEQIVVNLRLKYTLTDEQAALIKPEAPAAVDGEFVAAMDRAEEA